MPGKILIIEDDLAFQRMLREALEEHGHEVECASSAEEGIARLKRASFDLVLTDVKLPGLSGVDAIPRLLEADPGVGIVVMTAYSTRELALEAVRLGAYDFFSKPFQLSEMEVVIRRALEKQGLRRELDLLRAALKALRPSKKAVGKGPAMRQVLAMVEKIAPLETSVLLTGESGTGKEVVADLIHESSPRSSGPFIKVNCAGIPDNLLESDLFGHEKGAFTGAVSAKPGKFELAQGGTILLDEIGDMPLHLQPKLLRAVEQKRAERVGGTKPVSYDVRILASTNQDLAARIRDKAFREDLFYRLNVATIHLPPLRERKEDLPLLAEHFLGAFNAKCGGDIQPLSQSALDRLDAYHWPGNVRQFANVIERAAIFCRGNAITAADVELALQEGPRQQPLAFEAKPLPLRQALQEVERSLIVNALRQHGGVQIRAAKALGVTPTNLWNKIRKHAIDVDALDQS